MPGWSLTRFFGTRSPTGREIPDRQGASSLRAWFSAACPGGVGQPVPSRSVVCAPERRKAQESSGRGRPRFAVGTDLRREQSPGVAGHRDLLVLRAGARDVRNGMRVSAPRGVRLCEGVKLWRADNPTSGTGLRVGRHRREQAVKRVWNSEGGTNRVWMPGPVDLHADIAEGEENPMRGVPEPRRTPAERAKYTLKGSPSLRELPAFRRRMAGPGIPRGR